MPRMKTTDATAESQNDAAAPADSPEGASPTTPLTKGQAMDAAISARADLPADAVAYVKEHFGMDVSNKQFSTHKSLVRQKAAIDARDRVTQPAKKPTAAVAEAPATPARYEPPAPTAAIGPASPADLARQVKALVADHGADAVGEMVEVFRE